MSTNLNSMTKAALISMIKQSLTEGDVHQASTVTQKELEHQLANTQQNYLNLQEELNTALTQRNELEQKLLGTQKELMDCQEELEKALTERDELDSLCAVRGGIIQDLNKVATELESEISKINGSGSPVDNMQRIKYLLTCVSDDPRSALLAFQEHLEISDAARKQDFWNYADISFTFTGCFTFHHDFYVQNRDFCKNIISKITAKAKELGMPWQFSNGNVLCISEHFLPPVDGDSQD